MAGTTTRKAKLALDPKSEEGEIEKEKYHNNLDAALGDSRQTNTGRRRDRATQMTAL